MGFFERPDLRLAQIADPTPIGTLGRALKRHGTAFIVCVAALLVSYSVNLAIGLHDTAGTTRGMAARGLRLR